MTRFFKFQLRTTQVDAARAFYSAVLPKVELEIFPLHEQALARGARPHWLGSLDVEDVESALAAFAKHGGAPLSPKWVTPDGTEGATLRDPGGAVLGVMRPRARKPAVPEVGWHLLHTPDVDRCKAAYGELFGWDFQGPVDHAPHGVFHPFSWERGSAPVGAMTALRPGIHAHWLFLFQVPSLEPAVSAARDAGGKLVQKLSLDHGESVAVFDDPQGAAFALREGPRPR
jgi:predicted enzyme related to lactoylglutathione lyase